MNIAITGASGFLGKNLVYHLLNKTEFNLVIITRHNEPDIYDKSDRLSVRKTDYSPAELNEILSHVDQVIHFAGMRMPRAEKYVPLSCFYEANIETLEKVLLACAENRVKRLLFSSSIAIYGSFDTKSGITEDALPNPNNNYGLSKLIGENLISQFQNKYGLEGVSLRFSQIIGSGERKDLIVGTLVEKCLSNEEIVIHGGGLDKRDYLYIEDLNRLFVALLKEKSVSGVYNVGSGQSLSASDIASIIKQHFNSNSNITIPDTSKNPIRSFLNISKISEAVRWSPQFSFQKAIADMYKH